MNPYLIKKCYNTDLWLVVQKRWWWEKCLSGWDTKPEAQQEVKRLLSSQEPLSLWTTNKGGVK